MNITKQLNKYIEKSSEDIFIMLVFGIKLMLSSTIFRNKSQIHTVYNVLPVASRMSFTMLRWMILVESMNFIGRLLYKSTAI